MDRELINRSIDYILRHFDEDISVGDVAAHFHFSESYFGRAFREATGESVYELIMRLKMDQSAVDLKLLRNRAITDVGLDYGYSASNYSSAFKKHHSLSPAQFRKAADVTEMENPFYPEGATGFGTFEDYAGKIEIREIPDLTVIYERIIGSYVAIREQWPRFVEKYARYIGEKTLFIERFFDDPAVARPESCIYDICMTADVTEMPENVTLIKGGRYAVYRYEGRIEDIFCSVQGVFTVWLPASGYVMDKRFGLNIYPEMDASAESVVMELCIPIK